METKDGKPIPGEESDWIITDRLVLRRSSLQYGSNLPVHIKRLDMGKGQKACNATRQEPDRMKTVRIRAVRKVQYDDLVEMYENPILHTCNVREGQSWLSVGGRKPEGLCPEAWKTMREFVEALARGEGDFYEGWMKNPYSAMISCNDGFRPVSFYIETVE